MSRAELATAYGLLGEVVAKGPDGDRLAMLRASPALEEALATYPSDEAAEVDHEHAFGLNAPPFAGVFLDVERIAGAPLGELLNTLATERVDAAFLDARVLSWLPAWATAVRRLARPYPTALATQIEDVVLLHRSLLVDPVAARFELADPDLDLDDPKTDLRRIGEWLATPARSGVLVTRADIARVGGGQRVPRGFGQRAQLVVNLLRSAANLDAFDGVVRGLEQVAREWAEALAAPRYDEVRALARPWAERAATTAETLRRLRQRAAMAHSQPA